MLTFDKTFIATARSVEALSANLASGLPTASLALRLQREAGLVC
jgi:hypothetical protein